MRRGAQSNRLRRAISIALGLGMVLGQVATAAATQVPDPLSNLFLQTSGPNAGITIGDYYTAPAGGNTDHLFVLRVPSNWPDGVNVTVSLYDPELAGPNPASPTAADELRGGTDSATFTLESPSGATIATETYADASTNGAWIDLATFDPGSTGTGQYEIHVSVSDNDDNSWRVDASHDPDCPVGGPDTCGLANLQDGDESDSAPSGSSPLGLGVIRTSYQHAGTGLVCQDHVFYVNNSTPRPLRSHNFDMDNNGSVTYTTPAGGSVAGTVSGNGIWNGSADTNRVGDVLPDLNGWWAAELCISSNNQYVFESPSAGPSFPVAQPEPRLVVDKDDGESTAEVGEELTYSITIDNVSDEDSLPGYAHEILIEDVLPTGTTFVDCAAPTGVSCDHAGGVVTAEPDSTLAPGDSFSVDVTVSIGPGAEATLENTAEVTYEDSLGNDMPQTEDADTTVVDFRPELDISVSGADELLRGDSTVLTYSVRHSETSDESPVSNLVLSCAVCSSVAYVTGDDDNDGVLDAGEVWLYEADVESDDTTPDPLKVKARVDGLDGNGESTDAKVKVLIDLIEPGTISGSVFEDLDGDGVRGADEPGLENVEVSLVDSNGVAVASTTTDGSYEFTRLPPGEYEVVVDGSTVAKKLKPTTSESRETDLTEGESVTGVDFGYARRAAISGTVYHDADLSATRGGSEAGLSGVKVRLIDANGDVVAKTRTGADGSYEFRVLPGTYEGSLGSNIPTGWSTTTDASLETGPVVSDDNVSGLDFGVANRPPVLLDDGQTVTIGEAADAIPATDPEGTEVDFFLLAGVLAPGVTLQRDGTLSGTPVVAGTYEVTLELCDQGDPEACAEFDYTLVVTPLQVDDQEVLPITGLEVSGLGMIAVILMSMGTGLVVWGRRDDVPRTGV